MTTRRIRNRQHTRNVGLGLVVSLALHAVLLAGLSFEVPDDDATVGSRANAQADAPADFTSMEIVRIEEVEPVPEEPVVTDTRPVVATPSQEQVAQTPAGDPTPAGPSSGSPAAASGAAAPGPPSPANLLASLELESNVSLAMRPQFAGQRGVPGADQAIDEIDPHAGHDHEDDEGDNEDSWWRRLGVPFGSGGSQICKPRPPTVIHKAAVTP